MRASKIVIAGIVLAAACGDDDGGGGDSTAGLNDKQVSELTEQELMQLCEGMAIRSRRT